MTKLLVGILKGLVIGGAVGYGFFALGNSTGFHNPWVIYGLIGAVVGLVVGRPIWTLIRDKDQTSWIAVIKAAFGFGIGCGLYAIIGKVWHPAAMVISGFGDVFSHPASVGGAIGAVYGGFVELDDAIGDPPAKNKALAAKKPAGKENAGKPAKK